MGTFCGQIFYGQVVITGPMNLVNIHALMVRAFKHCETALPQLTDLEQGNVLCCWCTGPSWQSRFHLQRTSWSWPQPLNLHGLWHAWPQSSGYKEIRMVQIEPSQWWMINTTYKWIWGRPVVNCWLCGVVPVIEKVPSPDGVKWTCSHHVTVSRDYKRRGERRKIKNFTFEWTAQ